MSRVSLKKHIKDILKEKDKSNAQRFIDAEKLTNAAFQAGKEASAEARAAQASGIVERDLRYSERDKASKEAAELIASALREFKSGSNEWRGSLNDTLNRAPSREEVNTEIRRLNAMYDDLKERADTGRGSGAGSRQMWGYVAAGIGLVMSIVMFFAWIATTAIAIYIALKGGNP